MVSSLGSRKSYNDTVIIMANSAMVCKEDNKPCPASASYCCSDAQSVSQPVLYIQAAAQFKLSCRGGLGVEGTLDMAVPGGPRHALRDSEGPNSGDIDSAADQEWHWSISG